MSDIECENYCFSVKEFADGTPFISFEPRYRNLKILKDGNLSFQLPKGTTIGQAEEIANYLNSKNLSVVYDPLSE